MDGDGSATLAAMTTQTIPEYLEEERQKIEERQLRTEKEAARIQPLQHGHHRAAKRAKLESPDAVKAVTKKAGTKKAATRKREKKKTAVVGRKQPRGAGKGQRNSASGPERLGVSRRGERSLLFKFRISTWFGGLQTGNGPPRIARGEINQRQEEPQV